ncbi:MAG TPA: cysteine peptidase family C39 domain-containing protein [Anaerolineales bacterium]|nr:cysteine peptidase family C39 domain-containing protein [Anaerolineales bacterium]
MSNPPQDPKKFSRLRRIEQITENHCGPAVLQMLLENVGINAAQEEITEAASATHTIETHGTRVDQLAKAVQQLAPIAKLWFKEKATVEDLEYVLDVCKFPVGVEWQGLFDDMDDDDEDYGHYSIIANIDRAKDELIIVDPYKDFVDQNRIIRMSTFLNRWWDFNEVKDPDTGEKTFKKDEQLFFVVAPLSVTFPEELGMKSYY